MRLSLSTRIFLGFTVVIVAFGATSAYTAWRMTTLRASVSLIWEELLPVSTELKELSRRLRNPEPFLELRRATDAQWIARLLPALRPFETMSRVEERLATVLNHEALTESDRALVGEVVELLGSFRDGTSLGDAFEDGELTMLAAVSVRTNAQLFDWLVRRTSEQASAGLLTGESPEARTMRRVLRLVNRIVIGSFKAIEAPIRGLDARAAEDEKAATLAILLVASGALLVSLLILIMIQLGLRPIRKLREGARRIAAGDYEERVAVRARDEIGQLAEEFNTMAAALAARDAELARQREELLRAERLAAIGRVAAQITHEVRNPLSSIGLNVELLEELLEEDAGDEETGPLLRAVQREVDRLKGITEDYLQFARLPRPELAPTEVVSLVRQLAEFLAQEVADAGVTLDRSGLDESRTRVVDADADQLRQAFLNLARNALESVHAMPGPGRVALRLEDGPDGGVRITVADNGTGIDDAIRPRLFEPFVTGKRDGTGLGLALTHQIVREHGGTITVAEPGLDGRGASFSVALPGPSPVVPEAQER